jgi:hypothetical protein
LHQLLVKSEIPKTEIYIVGTRIFSGGLEVKITWTYCDIQRPDRTFNSEVQGVAMTKEGQDVATTTTSRAEEKR